MKIELKICHGEEQYSPEENEVLDQTVQRCQTMEQQTNGRQSQAIGAFNKFDEV